MYSGKEIAGIKIKLNIWGSVYAVVFRADKRYYWGCGICGNSQIISRSLVVVSRIIIAFDAPVVHTIVECAGCKVALYAFCNSPACSVYSAVNHQAAVLGS